MSWQLQYRRVTRALASLAAHSFPRDTPLVDPSSDVIVSLTSYGKRLAFAHLTIESISRGIRLPGRLVLNISTDDSHLISPQIKRLQDRGLELNLVYDHGPHKKWFSTPLLNPSHDLFVIADDDMLYPPGWLQDFELAAQSTPDLVLARNLRQFEGRSIDDIQLNKVSNVKRETSLDLCLAIGGQGAAYPQKFIQMLQLQGPEVFVRVAPFQDDIWLSLNAILSGHKFREVLGSAPVFDNYLSTYRTPLFRKNTIGGGNELAFQSTREALWPRTK